MDGSKAVLLVMLLSLTIVFLTGCVMIESTQETLVEENTPPLSSTTPTSSNQGSIPTWMKTELKDIKTRQKFTIDQFKGKPILLESFAVWCPTCTKQQKHIGTLHEEIGDAAVSISLNTDPNEDEARVKEHLETHGFDWFYAISPKELTQQLVDEFGLSVVNAPLAPVILICPDQSYRLLSSGPKSADELKNQIEKGC